MAEINETLGQNIENEIDSQEDQISKHGGTNISLEDFLDQSDTNLVDSTTDETTTNIKNFDNATTKFQNTIIDEQISKDDNITNDATPLSTIYNTAKGDLDLDILTSSDTSVNIEQNENFNNSVTINNNLTTEDIITAVELGETLSISGIALDAQSGDEITLNINGTDYKTTIDEDGTFSVDVKAIDISNEEDYTAVNTTISSVSLTELDTNKVIENNEIETENSTEEEVLDGSENKSSEEDAVEETEENNEIETENTTVVEDNPVEPNVLLEESFENLQDGRGWHVETGDVTGDHGTVWDIGDNGLEVQSKIVTASSDGDTHAELDAHHNVTMTTEVNLNDSEEYTVSFDVKPRDGGSKRDNEDTSDMQVTFGDVVVAVNSDNKGNLTFESNDDSIVVRSELNLETGWNSVVVEYSGLTDNSATLTIEGTGSDDSYGALLDNIKIIDQIDQNSDIDVVSTESISNDNGHTNNGNHYGWNHNENNSHANNGHGNGDQDAPGNSATHNNGENSEIENNFNISFEHIEDGLSSGLNTIDMSNGSHELTEVNINDVMDMTDEDNTLTILGDKNDSVTLDTDTTWSKGEDVTVDGNRFSTFTGGGNNGLEEVQILIDTAVHIDQL